MIYTTGKKWLGSVYISELKCVEFSSGLYVGYKTKRHKDDPKSLPEFIKN